MRNSVIIDRVRSLKPGEEVTISRREMMPDESLWPFRYNGAEFTPADVVLENIVGSAWGWSYRENVRDRTVTFRREEASDEMTYVSPDYRDSATRHGEQPRDYPIGREA